MDIGFVTHYSKEKVEMAGRNGFECLEVFVDKGTPLDLDLLTDEKLNEALELFKKNNVRFGTLSCCPNHLEGDEELRKQNNAYFIKALRICKKFGTDIVMTNAWADRAKSPEENLAIYKEVFSEYAKVAEEEGVRILIENCPHYVGYPVPVGNISFSPEMWDEMFKLVPSKSIGLEFDPSHLLWQGIDYIKAIRDYGDRIFAFHAKDTEILKDELSRYGIIGKQIGKTSEWDAGWWRYRIPGWGMVDWKNVFIALNDIGFDGPMFIEHEDPVYEGDRFEEGLILGRRHLKKFML